MKVSQLVISLLVLLMGVGLIMYSADQQQVMDVLVATHGGGPQVADADATGLRKLNSDLDAEVARISGERSAAIEATEGARVEMRDARDKRNDAEAKLAADKAENEDLKVKVESATKTTVQLRDTYNAALAKLKSEGSLDADTSDLGALVEAVKAVVDRENARKKDLETQLEEEKVVRDAATEKLAKEKVELNRINGINDRFFKDYMKNGDEFALLAVDMRWRFVAFKVGADSGLVAGDSTPLLVKRGPVEVVKLRIISIKDGMVTAEFDPKTLAPGVRPQVGDLVFRQKPLGS
ncbi:MAG: hypothetical protein E7034_09345 [Akkermansiaceae bacterium]|nr:hypothetical protein [Akkermansiaceae bacterium]